MEATVNIHTLMNKNTHSIAQWGGDFTCRIRENIRIKEYIGTGRLDDEENALMKFRFIRVHKSFLVNYSYIRDISRLGAELTINRSISIAQPRYNDVRRKFLLYKGEM